MIEFDVETTGLQPWSQKQHAFLYLFFDGDAAARWQDFCDARDALEAADNEPGRLEYDHLYDALGEAEQALQPDDEQWSQPAWIHVDDPNFRERVQEWFDRAKADPDGIRAWNSKFDRAFADVAGFDMPPDGRWHDGMLVAHAVDERRSIALKAVSAQLFGEAATDPQVAVKAWLTEERKRRVKASKETGEELIEPDYSDVPMELIVPYGLEDVLLQRRVCDHYAPVLADNADLAQTVEFERGVLDALYHVERRGIPASEHDYRLLEQEVVTNLDELEGRCYELAEGVEDFNPRSSAKIIEALKHRKADLSFMEKEGGQIKSANADNLRAVDDELALAVLKFRSEYKVLSTYVRPMLKRSYVTGMRMWKEPFIAPDGRIHANYRQVGTRTGRMSCSDPNMQNQPRDDLRLRYCIKAEPGHKLVVVDLKNIEMVLFAAYCGKGRLLDAVQAGEDLHALTAQMLGLRDRKRADGNIETARQLAKTYNFCRPLDVTCLTQRGWLRHDEVRVGDQTLGYNPVTRRNEWTTITGVHHFDDAPLVRMSSGSWKTTSTWEHNWVTEKQRQPDIQRFRTTEELNSEDRIILAAPADGLDSGPLTLLKDARRTDDWTQKVLNMTENERAAWITGIALGEGSRAPGNTDCWTIAQNEGPLYEAIKLALYMEGYRPSVGTQHENGTVPCKWVRASKPWITGQRLVKHEIGRGPVWCVTTELGSWTACENGEIGLTGNSRIYGGGLRTIKKSFRCKMDEARRLKNLYDKAYPEVRTLSLRIEQRLQDQGYISDSYFSGRRYRVAPRDSYKATNHLVQGGAAALFKKSLVAMHAEGIPVVALIHDEVGAHVPDNEAEHTMERIKFHLTNHPNLLERVPLAAEGDICEHWSDAKPLKDGSLFVPSWAKAA